MNHVSSPVPRDALRGVASGVLFMAFFSTLWAGIGVMGLNGWGGLWPPALAVLIGIALFLGGIALLRSAQRLSNQGSEGDAQQGKRTRLLFNITFATEGLLIAIASVLTNALNRFDLFFPIMAIIVGIHFFPLAALFEVKPYYLVGSLLCVLAVITLFVVPQSASLGGQQITAQWVVLGFGAALILWSVGIGLWMAANRLLAGQGRAVA